MSDPIQKSGRLAHPVMPPPTLSRPLVRPLVRPLARAFVPIPAMLEATAGFGQWAHADGWLSLSPQAAEFQIGRAHV